MPRLYARTKAITGWAVKQVEKSRPCRDRACLVDTRWRSVIRYEDGTACMEPRCFLHVSRWAEKVGIDPPRRETKSPAVYMED